MEKLNEKGKENIYSNTKFCKYHSLMYFEQSKSYYDKYISGVNEALFKPDILNSLNRQKDICLEYLEDIKSGAVVLLEASFSGGKLYSESKSRGFTEDYNKYSLNNLENNIEYSKKILLNYERALSSIQAIKKESQKEVLKSKCKKEAICIANIIKINNVLGRLKRNSGALIILAERCQFLIDNLPRDKNEEWHLDENEEWYKEFTSLYKILKDKEDLKREEYNELFSSVKQSNMDIFNEIEEKFNQNKIDFIDFILENHPYKDYKKDERDFNSYTPEILMFLIERYQPDNYDCSTPEEQLTYCIVHEISKKLSYLYQNFQ